MDKKIIIVGDAFIDRYWIGETERVSPEAPIPVVKVAMIKEFPGGAANVRQNLRSLGEDGRLLMKGLSAPQNYPIKNRLMCNDVQIARWDEDDYCIPFSRADLLPLVEADAIIVSDYGKGSLSEEVIQILSEVRVPLFVDTKNDPALWIESDAILFPNLREWKQYSQHYGWMSRVLLKGGAQGLNWVEYGETKLTSPSRAKFVKNVSGAGDTVLAAFVSAYLSGADRDWCLKFANSAAAVAVENEYTYSPTLQETLTKAEGD